MRNTAQLVLYQELRLTIVIRHIAAVIARQEGDVADIRTITIPEYSASEEELENFKRESLMRYGIPHSEAIKNLDEPTYEEPVTVSGLPGPRNYGW